MRRMYECLIRHDTTFDLNFTIADLTKSAIQFPVWAYTWEYLNKEGPGFFIWKKHDSTSVNFSNNWMPDYSKTSA